MRAVCVFAGSSPGTRPEYRSAVHELADTLVARGLHVVYGGASAGSMGILYEAVTAAGGTLTGVIPRNLADLDVADTRLSDLRIVSSMHERKALMADLADAFIALPGGLGTLEEFTEATTWTQLGVHHKPTGLLNTSGYYTHLLTFLDHTVTEGFLHPAHRQAIVTSTSPSDLIQQLQDWTLEHPGRWWENHT